MPCVKSKRSSPMGNDCLLHKHIPSDNIHLALWSKKWPRCGAGRSTGILLPIQRVKMSPGFRAERPGCQEPQNLPFSSSVWSSAPPGSQDAKKVQELRPRLHAQAQPGCGLVTEGSGLPAGAHSGSVAEPCSELSRCISGFPRL